MTRTPSKPTSTEMAFRSDRSSASSDEKRIDADLLIPGRGDPIKNATLIFKPAKKEGGKGEILFAGSRTSIPDHLSRVASATHSVPVLMPGLWDSHVHFLGDPDLDLDHWLLLPPSLAGMRCARDCAATLNAGYTSVREVGGYGVDIGPAIEEGYIPGPRIYAAGAPISQTAGHGDLHPMPLELVQDRIKHGLPLCVVDGVDESIKAVRMQIRRGAKVIKICSTGGVLSRVDSPTAAQFTNPELKAMVEEATRTNMAVASHAHGTEGIMAALNAGVKTIEHGSYLTKEAIDLMLEKKAMLVATRYIIVSSVKSGLGMPEESYRKVVELADAHLKSYKAAVKAGVKCALGTDIGPSGEKFSFRHGMNGHEFGFAVEAGMTPLQAIESGTANGPDTLGPQAPRSGQLKEGYDADFIALSHDPVDDIHVLSKPECVTHVWKGGKLMKAPGQPIGLI